MLSLVSRCNVSSFIGRGLTSSMMSRRFFHAAPITRAMEKVSFGKDLPGYVIGPSDAPGVIMLQEWWGISEEIKKQATKLSEAGYRVLLPDLYKGSLGLDLEEANHLMSNLDFVTAIDEIKQASAYLLDQGAPCIGITGFCMGGALTLCALQHDPNVSCGAVFYGIPARQVCQPEKIVKPVQCHFGEMDNMTGFSDMASAQALVEYFHEGGVPYEMHFYTGVGHAFMNENPDKPQITKDISVATDFPPAQEAQRSLAWSRLLGFFKINLSSS